MKHAAIAASILALTGTAMVTAPTRAGSPIPEIVERAAAFNAEATSGVIVEERHIELNASAGPMHFSQANDAMVLLQNGDYKRLRYLRIVENGKPLAPDRVAQEEEQNNAELLRGKSFFKQPFDEHYLRDYTFAPAACECAPHRRAIAFTSVVRDDQHGDGTMILDETSGKPITVSYTPDVLPEHASTGTTTETFGEAAPGVWTTISIQREYGGRVAIFHGNGVMIERIDHVQRFPDSNAGIAYLQRASL